MLIKRVNNKISFDLVVKITLTNLLHKIIRSFSFLRFVVGFECFKMVI